MEISEGSCIERTWYPEVRREGKAENGDRSSVCPGAGELGRSYGGLSVSCAPCVIESRSDYSLQERDTVLPRPFTWKLRS